jgi:hypothetical protein
MWALLPRSRYSAGISQHLQCFLRAAETGRSVYRFPSNSFPDKG